jgi:hypothetical protein
MTAELTPPTIPSQASMPDLLPALQLETINPTLGFVYTSPLPLLHIKFPSFRFFFYLLQVRPP